MSDWQPIDTAPTMTAILLHHPYYSHGQARIGYFNQRYGWMGVDASGLEGSLQFDPTHWMPLPSPPEPDHD